MPRRAFGILWRTLAVLPGLGALYLVAAVAGGLVGNGAPQPPPTNDEVRVGLAMGRVHTDLLLPLTPAVRARFAFADESGVPVSDPAAEWLVVGWGAEGVYTTVGTYADITAPVLWRGLTGDAAVMRIDVAGRIADFAGIDLLTLTPAQFDALAHAIGDSLARDAAGAPIALPAPGFTWSDTFYRARGRFQPFRTCNVWLSDMLSQAGVPFGAWTPTLWSVRLAVWRFVPDP